MLDVIIWFTVLIFFILLVISIVNFYKKSKKDAEDLFKARFNNIKLDDMSSLNIKVRGSVRLFHSMCLTKEDIQNRTRELKKLP